MYNVQKGEIVEYIKITNHPNRKALQSHYAIALENCINKTYVRVLPLPLKKYPIAEIKLVADIDKIVNIYNKSKEQTYKPCIKMECE